MAKNKSFESKKITINLNTRAKKSIQTVFFKWAVSIGKLIIVLTQLIALIALVYRFTVDRKIIDLHDEIEREQLFVDAQSEREGEFRALHTRLENIKTLTEKNNKKIEIINQILDSINKGSLQTTNFSVNQNRISFDGSSLSVFAINSFVEDLKSNKNVLSITIDDVNSSSQGIAFGLSITVAD